MLAARCRLTLPLPSHLQPQELMGPGNAENLTLAAESTGKTIPVHIYLYNHYADPWGYNFTTSAELQVRRGAGEDSPSATGRQHGEWGLQVWHFTMPYRLACPACRCPAGAD